VFASAIVKFIGKVLIVCLILFAGYLTYKYFTAEGPPKAFDHYREYVIEKATEALADAIAGTEEKPRKLLIKRLSGDATGRITYVLKQKLQSTGRAKVLEPEFTEDAEKSIREWFFSEVRGLVKPEEAKSLAERSSADYILVAEVTNFSDSTEETLLNIQFELDDINSEEIRNGSALGKLDKTIFSLSYLRLWMWSNSIWIRVLIWFLTTIFAPLVSYKIAWAVLAKQRNDYNTFLIAGYTFIDTLLAWILIGFTTSGFMASSLFIMALIGSGVWNFLILDELEDMRH